MAKTHPTEVKERVLAAALAGDDWKTMATHNGVAASTARAWVVNARMTSSYEALPSCRGGPNNVKMEQRHVDFLLDKLGDNCQLTLAEMAAMLYDKFGLTVVQSTVHRALEGAYFTVKKIHRDAEYRNITENKIKRKDFAIKLLEYTSERKVICYMDETNFNLWCTHNYGWSEANHRATVLDTSSKGKNIHVIACISRNGLEYSESRFGSFDSVAANAYVRRILRNLTGRYALENVVVVLDNAPCHTHFDDVPEEPEFSQASILRLGPYSPMLNAIENVFSVFKSRVKRDMAANRLYILQTPPGVTQIDHRSGFLIRAAEDILPAVVTPELCNACVHHTYGFDAAAILMEDMQVGQ